ncbi:AaceriAGR400Wp [[Ashbya] aceris (nom. inval.)]|nr:AaceriAGR400Wp [[Ashbya] aceris (nom. inval.)]
MVCDSVIYHPTLTRLVRYLDSTAGREKTLRLLQYLCRFLGFQYKSVLARQLQAQFTVTRKLLRFLKPLNHMQLAAKLYDNKIGPDELLRVTGVVKNIFSGAYLALDQVNLLRMLRIVPTTPFTATRLPRWTNWMWFGALVAGIVSDLRTLEVAQRRLATASPEKDAQQVAKTQEERFRAVRRLIWDCLDMFIVLNNLNFLGAQDGSVGLAGVATSLFGIQDLWNAA